MVLDHGVLRLFYSNTAEICQGVWRSSQPTPGRIRAFARRGGKSVISLRGGLGFGSRPLEIEACKEAGVAFHNLVFRSRALPTRAELRRAAELFRIVERPVLIHCKSGADRAGIACALFLVLAEGYTVAEAKRQLSLRYLHVRHSKTGILDAFFEAYEHDARERPMPFMDWVERVYDRERIAEAFKPTSLGRLIGDTLLRRE